MTWWNFLQKKDEVHICYSLLKIWSKIEFMWNAISIKEKSTKRSSCCEIITHLTFSSLIPPQLLNTLITINSQGNNQKTTKKKKNEIGNLTLRAPWNCSASVLASEQRNDEHLLTGATLTALALSSGNFSFSVFSISLFVVRDRDCEVVLVWRKTRECGIWLSEGNKRCDSMAWYGIAMATDNGKNFIIQILCGRFSGEIPVTSH